MKLKFFKPDLPKISKERLHKEMLREAIAIIVLETEANSEAAVREKLKRIALTRLKAKRKLK